MPVPVVQGLLGVYQPGSFGAGVGRTRELCELKAEGVVLQMKQGCLQEAEARFWPVSKYEM